VFLIEKSVFLIENQGFDRKIGVFEVFYGVFEAI
jgi:hypothetical protein